MKIIFLYFIPLLFISCLNQDVKTFDYSCIYGHWRYYDAREGYTELQISDSLYYYVDGGGEYTGPVLPIPYRIEEDSLFWLEDWGEKRKGFKIEVLDSLLVLETKYYGIENWEKFNPNLAIKNWTMENDSFYDLEFLERRDEYFIKKLRN